MILSLEDTKTHGEGSSHLSAEGGGRDACVAYVLLKTRRENATFRQCPVAQKLICCSV